MYLTCNTVAIFQPSHAATKNLVSTPVAASSEEDGLKWCSLHRDLHPRPSLVFTTIRTISEEKCSLLFSQYPGRISWRQSQPDITKVWKAS